MKFEATRKAGLLSLDAFVPQAGRKYTEQRNFDYGVETRNASSKLSPWLRHRVIAEWEVLETVLAQHPLESSTSFVQEIFWRGYFKGWLEQHPSVWQSYNEGLAQASGYLSSDYAQAISGNTGIACFDHWCKQLTGQGYLHNHARMWFASIWIFTLRLPWELGASFFLQHLLDGDPASNTLGWRWVAGLHTKGRNYLARAENIARFTSGQFNPVGELVEDADPLEEKRTHDLVPILYPRASSLPPKHHLYVVTEEDCWTGQMLPCPTSRVIGVVSPQSSSFGQKAVRAASSVLGGDMYVGHDWSDAIIKAAQDAQTTDIALSYMPIGYAADGMKKVYSKLQRDGFEVFQIPRRYDTLVWPHASKGFFKVKKNIPSLLKALGLETGNRDENL